MNEQLFDAMLRTALEEALEEDCREAPGRAEAHRTHLPAAAPPDAADAGGPMGL